MSTSRIPQAVDALVSLLTDALDATAVQVVDGMLLQNQERAGLTIGSDIDDSTFPWEQRWSGLGHATRQETFEVPCVLWVRTGDTEAVSDTRSEVFGYFGLIEATLRDFPDLDLNTNAIRAQVLPKAYAQPQTEAGLVCRIDFNINIEGVI